MKDSIVRVRFAPAPTGMMHLGNVRTALMNYLFARQKGGTFVLRVEDTDAERILDPGAQQIIKDLSWLNILYDEGPYKEGLFGPYFQSERTALYQKNLEILREKGIIYRCFCTQEELEIKRQRQIALKLPPRYDRMCAFLTPATIQDYLANDMLFIWRVFIDHDQTVIINDLARGQVKFELKNFSDFPITRQDGSFTFMFANFVDDMLMNISYIFRGEDHLSNTAGQSVLYKAFGRELPIFWHMPIITNKEGRKLSKRDFGFSLADLRDAGFLPEAMVNYLAILGKSFEQEILTLDELTRLLNFDEIQTAGQIRYDEEKLRWINHKWIIGLDPADLAQRCYPYLRAAYPAAEAIDTARLSTMLQISKTELGTLADCVRVLAYYFEKPAITAASISAHIPAEQRSVLIDILSTRTTHIDDAQTFIHELRDAIKTTSLSVKELFWFLRLALMGTINGPAIGDLIAVLGAQEARQRIEHALHLLRGV